jgi:glucan biosynthesis protein C
MCIDIQKEEGVMQKRLWFVDNLRVLLISLVILHHTAGTYSGLDSWYYHETPVDAGAGFGLTVFQILNQSWFMGAFFLLSGFFTPGSFDRKGPRAFLRDRLIRLGIPLVVFYFVVNPLLYLGSGYHGGSALDTYLHTIGTGPLWFVVLLLVFDCSYAAFRHSTRNRQARAHAPRPPRFRLILLYGLVPALITYSWRIVVPIGFWLPVVDFPSSGYLPQYVTFFVLGIVAYQRGWFTAITGRTGWAGLGMAVGATVVLLPLALAGGLEAWQGGGTAFSLCYALWDSTFAVGLVLALLVLFRARLNAEGPVRRYLATVVFSVYMIHALVVTAVGHALRGVHLSTLPKFALAALVALPACFLLAGPVRKLPGVRRVL